MDINNVLQQHGIGVGKYRKNTKVGMANVKQVFQKNVEYSNLTFSQNLYTQIGKNKDVYFRSGATTANRVLDGVTTYTYTSPYNILNCVCLDDKNGFLYTIETKTNVSPYQIYVRKLNAATGAFIEENMVYSSGTVSGVWIEATGANIFVGLSNGTIRKLNKSTYAQIGSDAVVTSPLNVTGVPKFDYDNDKMLVGSGSTELKWLKISDLTLIQNVVATGGNGSIVDFDINEDYIAIAQGGTAYTYTLITRATNLVKYQININPLFGVRMEKSYGLTPRASDYAMIFPIDANSGVPYKTGITFTNAPSVGNCSVGKSDQYYVIGTDKGYVIYESYITLQ